MAPQIGPELLVGANVSSLDRIPNRSATQTLTKRFSTRPRRSSRFTEAEILSSYPTLKSEDIQPTIHYTSDLASGRVVTLPGRVDAVQDQRGKTCRAKLRNT